MVSCGSDTAALMGQQVPAWVEGKKKEPEMTPHLWAMIQRVTALVRLGSMQGIVPKQDIILAELIHIPRVRQNLAMNLARKPLAQQSQ
jgi:hypothetical protein